jgi:hypothetical protein
MGFLIIIGLASLGAVIWGSIDAGSHPDWAWQQAGQSKVTWILLQVVLLILCGVVGAIFSIVYFTAIRPKVIAAEQGGGGPGYGYGAPPSSYGGYSAPPPPPPGGFGGDPPESTSGPFG